MKKILIIHNRYNEFGGEDVAVENEIRLLNSYPKFEVKHIYYENKNIDIISAILIFILNRNIFVDKRIKKEIKIFNPDLIYIHNTWFYISLGIFKIIQDLNLNTILKIHNYRYFCTQSISLYPHFKETKYCKACGNKKKKYRFINKYYEDSFIKSIFILRYGKAYIKILKKSNFRILVLNQFHKNFLEKEFKINKNRIFIIPNYLDIEITETKNNHEIIYAGRVSKQKGVEYLIKEFLNSKLTDFDLIIIGEGPELDSLKIKYNIKNIQFLGAISNLQVIERIRKAYGVVTATTMYEGQPTILCEASLNKKVSIFPDNGGISEYFPNNYPFMFENLKYGDLTSKFNLLLNKDLVNNFEEKNYLKIVKILDKNLIIEKFKDL